jgi:hypothetical protein
MNKIKLTQEQIDLFAKIHVGNLLQFFDLVGLKEIKNISKEDKDNLVNAIHLLGKEIGEDYPLTFANNKEIIAYILENS